MKQRAGRPGARERGRHRAGDAARARLRPTRTMRTKRVMARLLTPVAKFWICKRGSHFAQEAMECLGGNGYVEEGGEGMMARIYREMPLNSIWEGAGNIMALDLLRGAAQGRCGRGAGARTGAGARRACRRSTAWPPRCRRGSRRWPPKLEARRLAQDVALAVQAALLLPDRAAAPCSPPSAIRGWRGDWGQAFGTLRRRHRFRRHHCARACRAERRKRRRTPCPT